jgi:putative nucleotidyltransferase with HDIG domain
MNKNAKTIIQRLKDAGHKAFLVGGCVRDFELGREPKDFDIVTSAKPDQIEAIMKGYKTLSVGKQFGIVVVVIDNEPFEIASFRRDVGGSDGRHPDSVEFASSIEEDLSRRDFTCNAIALDPTTVGWIVDPFDGRLDINNQRIRFVGDPKQRIAEDRLRVMRAFRFMSQLGFIIESNSMSAIEDACIEGDVLKGVSQERITAELTKILIGDNCFPTIKKMAECGILFDIIPELDALRQPHNSPWHREQTDSFGNSIFSHVLLVVKEACIRTANLSDSDKLIVRLAAIMHDIGKAACRVNKGDHDSFMNHDIVGAKMTAEILPRMRFENDVVEAVTRLVRSHMNAHDIAKMKRVAKVRKLLGRPDIDNLLRLCQSDEAATLNTISDKGATMRAVKRWREAFPTMLPSPIVSGNDLIAAGAKPGPKFKDALDRAYEIQLSNEGAKRDSLLKFALNELK